MYSVLSSTENFCNEFYAIVLQRIYEFRDGTHFESVTFISAVSKPMVTSMIYFDGRKPLKFSKK